MKTFYQASDTELKSCMKLVSGNKFASLVANMLAELELTQYARMLIIHKLYVLGYIGFETGRTIQLVKDERK